MRSTRSSRCCGAKARRSKSRSRSLPVCQIVGMISCSCAKVAPVEFIVTGNKRHFSQRACGAIRVVNATELLDRITLEI
jgi:hypothetical protein